MTDTLTHTRHLPYYASLKATHLKEDTAKNTIVMPTTDDMIYDLRVPRYTSYPTAPHFHDGVTPHTYTQWLANVGRIAQTGSLYVHIPFCRKLCNFCGCNMMVATQERPIKQYLRTLEQEMNILVSHMDTCPPIQHLHFGGGSPTILEPDDFVTLMGQLQSRFPFAKGAELAIEIDPRTASKEKIDAYTDCGINRASLGIQDFNQKVQETVNRVQPYDMVHDTIAYFRHRGVNSINVDVMYGLPYQTVNSLQETIEQVITLDPDRIAVFGYAHVPWMKKHQKLLPEEHMADISERWQMYQAVYEILTQNGYTAIGLDHFAKNTDSIVTALNNRTLHRNFQGYTTDSADVLFGIGQSSIGWMPQGYIQNDPNINGYSKAIKQGTLPTIKGYTLTNEDRQRRDIIESIMCYMDVNLDDFTGRYGVTINYTPCMNNLIPFVNSGDVTITDNRVKITEQGRALMRIIASQFDTHLARGQKKHSSAI